MSWLLVLLLACGGPAEEEKKVLGVEVHTEVEPVAPLIAATSSPQPVGPLSGLKPGMPADEAEAVFDTLRHPVRQYLDKEIEGRRVIGAPVDGYDRLSVTLILREDRLEKLDVSFASELEDVLVEHWGPGEETEEGRVWKDDEGVVASLTRTEAPLPRVVVSFPAR